MANLLPILVIPTITLLMIDIIVRILRRKTPQPTAIVPISSEDHILSLTHDLAATLERVQDDFSVVEHQATLCHIREEEMEVARMIDSMYSTFVRPRPRPAICGPPSPRRRRRRRLSSLCDGYKTDALDTTHMSGAFTSFCEHLLASNHIWKQEKQLKKLRSEIQSAEASRQTHAFNAFCNQLILQNKVWQLEKQVIDLEIEGEQLKKRVETTVKRSAKKMMEELQHHRLIEGYVKDMIAEVDSYKLALGSRDALHEHELQQFTWEWYQEYRKLVREVEGLKLAQQAGGVLQVLQTEHEDSLYESLQAAQCRVRELEARLEGYQHTLVNTLPLDDNDDATEVDYDDCASMSSFTCVSVSYDGREASLASPKSFSRLPPLHLSPRKTRPGRRINILKRKKIAPPKRLIIDDHTGFSFNPLFYGSNVSPLVLKKRRPFDAKSDNMKIANPMAGKQSTSGATAVRWKI